MEIKHLDVVLCKFYFSDLKKFKNRPVLVFKDNLPHYDFIAIPISSKTEKMHEDELLITTANFVQGTIPITSKLMLRKTFVVSKESVIKRYGTISEKSYQEYHNKFCKYFGCNT